MRDSIAKMPRANEAEQEILQARLDEVREGIREDKLRLKVMRLLASASDGRMPLFEELRSACEELDLSYDDGASENDLVVLLDAAYWKLFKDYGSEETELEDEEVEDEDEEQPEEDEEDLEPEQDDAPDDRYSDSVPFQHFDPRTHAHELVGEKVAHFERAESLLGLGVLLQRLDPMRAHRLVRQSETRLVLEYTPELVNAVSCLPVAWLDAFEARLSDNERARYSDVNAHLEMWPETHGETYLCDIRSASIVFRTCGLCFAPSPRGEPLRAADGELVACILCASYIPLTGADPLVYPWQSGRLHCPTWKCFDKAALSATYGEAETFDLGKHVMCAVETLQAPHIAEHSTAQHSAAQRSIA